MRTDFTDVWDRRTCDAKASAWFALNASAIRVEAVDGLDGYTILRLPASTGDGSNGEESNETTGGPSEADGEGDIKNVARPAVEYMLWELASAADGRC